MPVLKQFWIDLVVNINNFMFIKFHQKFNMFMKYKNQNQEIRDKNRKGDIEPLFLEFSARYEKYVAEKTAKYNKLRDIDCFVLDNSIRESSVGQVKGHTVENKWHIYNEVKKCGFKHIIVAAFSNMKRVDDVFVQELVDSGEDLDRLWAFSEITDGTTNGIPDMDTIPIGMKKIKQFGLYNIILELDLGDSIYNFEKISIKEICALLKKRILWCLEHLNKKPKIMINFRDPNDVMNKQSLRLFQVVDYLAKLPKDLELFGLVYEEPTGKSFPEECGSWGKYIRKVMDNNKWDGHLLVHVHKQYGYGDATALHALIDGCDGIWACVCIEGSSMGNASSCVTLMNLIRLGNKKVLDMYNCSYLRQAAINITKIVTGSNPSQKEPVYGTLAMVKARFLQSLSLPTSDRKYHSGDSSPKSIRRELSDERRYLDSISSTQMRK